MKKSPSPKKTQRKPQTDFKKLPFSSRNHISNRKNLRHQYEISETKSSDNENFPSMLAVLKNE